MGTDKKRPAGETGQKTDDSSGDNVAHPDPAVNPAATVPLPLNTQAGLAECLASVYRGRFIYEPTLTLNGEITGRWLKWEGHTWTPDGDGAIRRAVVDIIRNKVLEGGDNRALADAFKTYQSLLSNAAIRGVVDCAKTTPGLYIPIEELKLWDARPDLLGTPNGVVSLRTGALSPGHPDDRITKQTRVEYDPGAKLEGSRYERFRTETLPSLETVEWFDRVHGYWITGETDEGIFVYCYGYRAHNGKSTLANLITAVMGDYAGEVSIAALEVRKNGGGERSTPFVMDFDGPRIVFADEVPVDGRGDSIRLDEARIKKLTGLTYRGRGNYQAPVSFTPAKLCILANHLPKFKDRTNAIWDRFKPIPFPNRFIGNDADAGLLNTMIAEGPVFLNHAVQNAIKFYQQRDMTGHEVFSEVPPGGKTVLRETRLTCDPYYDFLNGEQCILEGKVEITTLYQAFTDYWIAEGQKADYQPGPKVFTRALKELGIESVRVGKAQVRFYKGVSLNSEQ